MHLCCVREPPFNVCIQHISVHACWAARCAVKWRCTGTMCWQPPCDRGLAAVFWATRVYLGHNATTKKKTNQVNMGGLSVPDLRSVRQRDFLSDCLLVYSYWLMSPLPSPNSHEWRTIVQRRRYIKMLWSTCGHVAVLSHFHVWWMFICGKTIEKNRWRLAPCECVWRLNSLHTQNISTCKIHH